MMLHAHAVPVPENVIRVAVGVLQDPLYSIFVAERPQGTYYGGFWEFPGGKVEPGESFYEALTRELQEELGIHVQAAQPLIQFSHHYPERTVWLDVWKVTAYEGIPQGLEQQKTAWVPLSDLPQLHQTLTANRTIITALRLPSFYYITPEPTDDFELYLEKIFAISPALVLFRAKKIAYSTYEQLAQSVIQRCHARNIACLIQGDPDSVDRLGADGLHLTAADLRKYTTRPLAKAKWLAASTHNLAEIQLAEALATDFITLSPVQATTSHPEANPLLWKKFAELVSQTALPCYALGGLTTDDYNIAIQHGAQGIAGIRGLYTFHR